MEDDLAESVRRARRGDVDAFGRLIRATERMAYAVARRVLGNSTDALDAVQEAYLLAFRRLADLHDEAAFPVWLRRIAITCATDLRRRRRGTFLQVEDVAVAPILDEAETRWSAGQRAALARALLELSAGERRICHRHYHWGWSVARLAADAQVNEAAMRKRLQRVRDLLRRTMEMQEQQQFHDGDLPSDLPAKIIELLSKPSLVDVPENPVGSLLEQLQTQFAGFAMVEAPEVIDLPQLKAAMGFDPVYIDAGAIYHVDAEKILRYDLSLPLLMTARSRPLPLRVLSAGKVYRNDGISKTHLEAFHQFEVLELDDVSRIDAWSFASRILKSIEAILPGKSVRITPTEYAMCTKAWELSVETNGTWTEVLAWGEYIPRITEFLGGDPTHHTALGAGLGLERLACLVFHIEDLRQVELASVGSS